MITTIISINSRYKTRVVYVEYYNNWINIWTQIEINDNTIWDATRTSSKSRVIFLRGRGHSIQMRHRFKRSFYSHSWRAGLIRSQSMRQCGHPAKIPIIGPSYFLMV